MEYKDFDRLIGSKSANAVMLELKKKPYNLKELGEKLNLDRTSVYYHINLLVKKGMAEKKLIRITKRKGTPNAYYGLTKEFRLEDSEEGEDK